MTEQEKFFQTLNSIMDVVIPTFLIGFFMAVGACFGSVIYDILKQ